MSGREGLGHRAWCPFFVAREECRPKVNPDNDNCRYREEERMLSGKADPMHNCAQGRTLVTFREVLHKKDRYPQKLRKSDRTESPVRAESQRGNMIYR